MNKTMKFFLVLAVISLFATSSYAQFNYWDLNGNPGAPTPKFRQRVGFTSSDSMSLVSGDSARMTINALYKHGINFYTTTKFTKHVGIGTDKITDANFMLSVEGYIRAREVVVNADTWADYVFDKDYKLMTLDALEKSIKLNKHLPGIPSESEVCEKGISVSEMNVKLLKTVEELTLYTIELNKRIKALEAKEQTK